MFMQANRSPLPVIAADGFLVWVCVSHGRGVDAAIWLLASTVLQVIRRLMARRYLGHLPAADEASAAVDPARLGSILFDAQWYSCLLGFARAVAFAWLFTGAPIGALSMATMVTVALASGAIASFAGMTRTFLSWNTPVFAAMVWAWLHARAEESTALAALLVVLYLMLWAHVRDQSRLIERTVDLAQALKVERDRARAASDSKTRFFAAASHDLRQPLHALSINATTLELLARRRGDAMIEELSRSIGRALRQSNALLDSLLDISLLDANVVPVHIERVSAGALVAGLREEFASTAALAGLSLVIEEHGGPLWMATDARQLRRLLGNLVSNALKFTSEGGVRIVVEPLLDSAQRRVRVAIVDSGPGIEASEQLRIFEEFYQISNSARDRSKGLGLGLSIVERVARLLGVGVTLHSQPGAGARFDVDVPAAEAAADCERPQLASPPSSAEVALHLGVSVLAIDDESDILDSLARMLPHFGCEVRCANGWAQAGQVLDRGFVPQVLVVDHRLNGELGGQVIVKLRERLGNVAAVLVTGDAVPADMRQALGDDVPIVHKPIDGRELVQAIARSLGAKPQPTLIPSIDA
jgi:signal transduction histidine kinase/CheY-like chemotaxis protein